MRVVDERRDRVVALIEAQPQDPDTGDGVAGFLHRLCLAATGALAARGAGISLMADGGVHGTVTASDPATAALEETQFVLGEGPCIDAFADRRPVLVSDLGDGAATRWPAYTAAVLDGGVRAVFAFPLQVGAGSLGVLDVFRADKGPMSAEHLAEALTFADVAVNAVLDGQDRARPGSAADGLDAALDSRAQIFQAQGMVMVQIDGTLTAALARMRAHAYAHNRALAEVARDVVQRRLQFERDQP